MYSKQVENPILVKKHRDQISEPQVVDNYPLLVSVWNK